LNSLGAPSEPAARISVLPGRRSTAFIYFGERTYIKRIGLKPSWKKPLTTGGLDGRLVKYELY